MTKLSSREKARLVENLVDELNGAALYDSLASAEKDERLSEVYRRLAVVERKHADRWQKKLEEAGETLPSFAPSWRTKTLSWMARRFGTGAVLPSVAQFERADTNKYAGQADARDFHGDERSHSRVISLMSSMRGGFAGSEVAQLEGRHRTAGGNALRAAVLGANDGLVSNLSLVMGVAGAALNERSILITGLAGLLAGAGSMALGEWLSVQSSRELYRHQISAEAEEIANMPEEEEEELALIYQARGLDEAQARQFAASVMSNHDTAVETMAREELGIDPAELGGSAWVAAITSFLLFSLGAIVPVLPFFFTGGTKALILSVVFSTLALFLLGGAITLFTGRPVFASGSRQVVFGLVAAALTFGVGRLVGVSLG
ncbi:MAG: vacuolar iron transporter family protein [Acidobacteriota bacterium]|jgi:VIT1/CCC1 family predicted Fe2+/Mn2+ transporter|nr:vacuolar iron transporter family protein [Acidobacteriota bacterium]